MLHETPAICIPIAKTTSVVVTIDIHLVIVVEVGVLLIILFLFPSCIHLVLLFPISELLLLCRISHSDLVLGLHRLEPVVRVQHVLSLLPAHL